MTCRRVLLIAIVLLAADASGSDLLRVEDTVLQPQFTVYGTDDGLPSNQVRALHQDRSGLLWIGTYGGLASFDGSRFENWRAPDDPRPLVVEFIAEDSAGALWVTAEKRGVYRLDLTRSHWLHYGTDEAEPHQLRSDDIWAFAPDGSGGLWLGGYAGGLHYIDAQGHVHTDLESTVPRVSSEQITALQLQPNGLWIGTNGQGLWHVPSGTGTALACEADSDALVSQLRADGQTTYAMLGDGRVLAMGADCVHAELIYHAQQPEQIATTLLPELGGITALGLRNGLAWAEPGREALAWLKVRPGAPGSLPPGIGTSLLKDREGGYWAGIHSGGLAYLPPGADQILFVPNDGGHSGGLRGRSIRGMTLAPDGAMWVGSIDGGLERVDPALSHVSAWTPPADRPITRFSVRATAAWHGQLWVGHRDGLWTMPMEGERLGAITAHDLAGVHLLLPDGEVLWAAARTDALYRLDRSGSVLSRFAPGQLAGDEVNQLLLDPEGELWVASDGGLQRYDRQRDRLDFDPLIARGDVSSFCFEGESLWRYSDAGLEQFDRHTRRLLHRFESAAGIPALDTATLQCRGDTLWLLTRNGFLAWSVARTATILEWRRADGVPPVELGRSTFGTLQRGRFWTGGEGGLLGLTLELPAREQVGFPLHLASLRTQRGEEWIDLAGPKIVLQAQDRNLHLSARAIAFHAAAATQFDFQLDGDDGSHQTFRTENGELDIARLASGHYRLQIGAQHPRLGMALNQPQLQIEVLPVWYQTSWARIAAVLAVLLLGAAVFDNQRRRLKARHARQLAQQRLHFAEQLAEEKSRFLAQSSHEMKNLLGGASGMAELIAAQSEHPAVGDKAQRLVELCADLSRLLDDLLDNARLERGQISLAAQWFDPIAVFETVLADLRPRAEQKGLDLRAALPASAARRRGDPLRLCQIVANLLSNAVKYTEVGSVRLDVELDDPGQLRLIVCDSGPGIAEEARSRLFEPFALGRNRRDSTGLGLWICKQLCELCGGEIAVTSDADGTCFKVELPWVIDSRAGSVVCVLIVASAPVSAAWLQAAEQLGIPATGAQTLLAVLANWPPAHTEGLHLLLPGAPEADRLLAETLLSSRTPPVVIQAPAADTDPADYLARLAAASSK